MFARMQTIHINSGELEVLIIQGSNALTGVSKNIDRQNRHFLEKDERIQKNRLAKKLGTMKRMLSFQTNKQM